MVFMRYKAHSASVGFRDKAVTTLISVMGAKADFRSSGCLR